MKSRYDLNDFCVAAPSNDATFTSWALLCRSENVRLIPTSSHADSKHIPLIVGKVRARVQVASAIEPHFSSIYYDAGRQNDEKE